nr:MAG: hypothetical protein AmFV_00153 [Apis mellifera filamentous virus]
MTKIRPINARHTPTATTTHRAKTRAENRAKNAQKPAQKTRTDKTATLNGTTKPTSQTTLTNDDKDEYSLPRREETLARTTVFEIELQRPTSHSRLTPLQRATA